MRIENMDQLNAEIKRLKVKSEELKVQLKQDYEEIKEELKRMNIFLDTVSNISGFKINRDSLFEKGFSIGLQLLMQRLFMKAELGVENQARHLIEKALAAISRLLKKLFNKGKKEAVPEDDGNYTGE